MLSLLNTLVISASVAAIAIILGVVFQQEILAGQTTTTWSTGTITLTFLLPLILAGLGVAGILKLMGK